jgi:hypothetical protein
MLRSPRQNHSYHRTGVKRPSFDGLIGFHLQAEGTLEVLGPEGSKGRAHGVKNIVFGIVAMILASLCKS